MEGQTSYAMAGKITYSTNNKNNNIHSLINKDFVVYDAAVFRAALVIKKLELSE